MHCATSTISYQLSLLYAKYGVNTRAEFLTKIYGDIIENYKNILDYKENLILVQGKTENLKITGRDFRIDYFTRESMHITGIVEQIDFQRNGKKN